jgi:hypothetical protein
MASLAVGENENETVYFISHVQAESKDIALEFFYSMEKVGKKCWLDVKMKERDEDAMKEGIKLCEIVLIIMSPNYFTRPFCVKELEWAVEFGKPIVVVIDVALKSEIGNILSRCPADKSYLKGIQGINFNEVFRGNPVFWEASMKQVVEAKPKILKRDGTVAVGKNENETVYFLSHYQAEGGAVARDIYYSMKEKGIKCWLDVKMREQDEDAMREGVKLCEIVLIIMSPNYFTRPFCVKELEWAVEFGKPIVVVIDRQYCYLLGYIVCSSPPHLRGIGKIDFNPIVPGTNSCINLILKAEAKILKKDGTVANI